MDLKDLQHSKGVTFLFLIAILILAAFFRLWQLDEIPPGLYPDVAMNGNDVFETLKTGNFKVFYPDNQGREGLFMWLIAFSFLVFGVSIWSIKIVAAIIGILTVWGLYLLIKELFNRQIVQSSTSQFIALLSSFFLATSFWHTNFSRIGFRAILVPFVLVFGFYFLFKGFRTKRVLNFIIASIFFGLGFYTYISYRFIVLLLPLVLLYWLYIYQQEKQMKKFWSFTACFLIFTFIVALPIGIYFLENPKDFTGRASNVSIFNSPNPIKEFAKSVIVHLQMFNFRGDFNWRHNFSGSPMLFWPIGILFLIGLFISIKKTINFLKNKDLSLFVYLFLIAWFFTMLLSGFLSIEGIPHGLRVIGVIPVVYIFAGLGGNYLYNIIEQKIKNKKFLFLLFFFFIFLVTYSEFQKYFFSWGRHPKVKSAFTEEYYNIGWFMNSLPDDTLKYVIVNRAEDPLYGISIPGQVPMFIERSKFGYLRSNYIKAEELDKIRLEKGKKTIIVPLYNGKIIDNLKQRFPQGEIEEKQGFLIYKINN